VFKNSKQTECLPYPQVKSAHKQIKEQALLIFKDKAVGDNLQEFVAKVEQEIQKKYLAVKNKCLSIFE
jgi:hypothetical protein